MERCVPGTQDTMCKISLKKMNWQCRKTQEDWHRSYKEKKICSNINKSVYREKLKTPIPEKQKQEERDKQKAGNTFHKPHFQETLSTHYFVEMSSGKR